MSEFVDANILLRLLSGDLPDQTQRSLRLFERAEHGELELHTSEAVVAEVVHVLSSPVLYATPRREIAVRLGTALANRGLRLDHKESVVRALHLYAGTSLHFVDCLCVERCRRLGLTGIYSFGRALDRIPEVRRLEPELA
jgi:predicted nucleic acid-binding protein